MQRASEMCNQKGQLDRVHLKKVDKIKSVPLHELSDTALQGREWHHAQTVQSATQRDWKSPRRNQVEREKAKQLEEHIRSRGTETQGLEHSILEHDDIIVGK